jgi:hypothetical protein
MSIANYEKPIKKIPFDGMDEGFRKWEPLAMTYATSHGFLPYLLKEIPICSLDDTLKDDVNPALLWHYKGNADAITFLTQSCDGVAQEMVLSAVSENKPRGDAYLVWKLLTEHYKGRNVGRNLGTTSSDCQIEKVGTTRLNGSIPASCRGECGDIRQNCQMDGKHSPRDGYFA